MAAVCCCFPLAAARRKNGGEGGTHEERELALADEAALDVLVRRLELPAAVRVRAHGLDPADPRRRVLLRRRQRVHRRRRRGSGHRRTRCRVHRPLSLSPSLCVAGSRARAAPAACAQRSSIATAQAPPAATRHSNQHDQHCKGKSGAPPSRSRRVQPRSRLKEVWRGRGAGSIGGSTSAVHHGALHRHHQAVARPRQPGLLCAYNASETQPAAPPLDGCMTEEARATRRSSPAAAASGCRRCCSSAAAHPPCVCVYTRSWRTLS